MLENWEIHWKDYYKTLQLDPSAEPEVIKGAFERLARKYHPDINKDAHAGERMKALNEAYDILGNQAKKSRYDIAWRQQSGQGARQTQQNPNRGPQGAHSTQQKARTANPPRPIADPSQIRFTNVQPGETKRASFTIKNVGGPYTKIAVNNPDSWVKVSNARTITSASGLPIVVEIEATGAAWSRVYVEYIAIKLDDEEFRVRIELETKPEQSRGQTVPNPAAGTKTTAPPQSARSKGSLAWLFALLIIIGSLVGVYFLMAHFLGVSSGNDPTTTTSITSTQTTIAATITTSPQQTTTTTTTTSTPTPIPTIVTASPGQTIAALKWIDSGQDLVSTNRANPDGISDGHFLVSLNINGNKTIKSLRLYTTDSAGNPVDGQVWISTSGFWFLGVYRNGVFLNPQNSVISGLVNLDIFGDDSGYFKPGKYFSITVDFTDNTEVKAITTITMVSTPVPTSIPTLILTPNISSISDITANKGQVIVIQGQGFGSLAPYDGNSNYIKVYDVTSKWGAGYSGTGENDAVHLNITKWSDNEIVISGMTGAYGGSWSLLSGDQIEIQVWNTASAKGPAIFKTVVKPVSTKSPASNKNYIPLTSGTVSGELTISGETDTYSFQATTGDTVFINVIGSSAELWLSLKLYDPTGKEIGSGESPWIITINKQLTAAGVYTISVKNTVDSPPKTGPYTMSFNMVSQGMAQPVTSGPAITGKLAIPGEVQYYSFQATTGDTVFINVIGSSAELWLSLKLYDPTGKEIGSGESPWIITINKQLTAAGVYTISVKNTVDSPPKTGPYTMSFNMVSQGMAQPVTSGLTITGKLAIPGEVQYYSFQGKTGDKVLITLPDTGTNYWLSVKLYDPTGKEIGSGESPWAITIDKQLTKDGIYTISVKNTVDSPPKIGTYRLNFRNNLN